MAWKNLLQFKDSVNWAKGNMKIMGIFGLETCVTLWERERERWICVKIKAPGPSNQWSWCGWNMIRWRFPKLKYLYRWMVYLLNNAKQEWMMERGTPIWGNLHMTYMKYASAEGQRIICHLQKASWWIFKSELLLRLHAIGYQTGLTANHYPLVNVDIAVQHHIV